MIITHQMTEAVNEQITGFPFDGMAIFSSLRIEMRYGNHYVPKKTCACFIVIFHAKSVFAGYCSLPCRIRYNRKGQDVCRTVNPAIHSIDFPDRMIIAKANADRAWDADAFAKRGFFCCLLHFAKDFFGKINIVKPFNLHRRAPRSEYQNDQQPLQRQRVNRLHLF